MTRARPRQIRSRAGRLIRALQSAFKEQDPMNLTEAQAAVEAADNLFQKGDVTTPTKLTIGAKNDINLLMGNNGTLFNYGVPDMYELPTDSIPQLKAWWESKYPGNAKQLEPQLKTTLPSGPVWNINLTRKSGNNMFNMHIGVPVPAPAAPPVPPKTPVSDNNNKK